MITPDQRESWDRDGFFILPRFAAPDVCKAMLERVSELCTRVEAGSDVASALRLVEPALRRAEGSAADRTSKLFRIHRHEPVFNAFCRNPRLLALVASLLGPDLDCFLSQFIFKNPGALGQPWHQDAFYFPFDRRPQVGVWLAVTAATLENGPLWVLPGSQREPIHAVVPDRREHAQMGYVEIVDHDVSGERPVLLEPGDLLVFHGQLMHKSTDNRSESLRAAMVYHYGEAGTVDHTLRFRDFTLNDWLPVLRAGKPVGESLA
ncbi:MAG TPA: phytanoyl-CoA dioxygenase family protein [Myxococcota bacterium]|nr:phytanoyl-CoA dioxygenase family protein [Myxococcota bacterium]